MVKYDETKMVGLDDGGGRERGWYMQGGLYIGWGDVYSRCWSYKSNRVILLFLKSTSSEIIFFKRTIMYVCG